MIYWLEAMTIFLLILCYSCAFIWAAERFRECLEWDGFDPFSTAAITFIVLTGVAIIYTLQGFLAGGI